MCEFDDQIKNQQKWEKICPECHQKQVYRKKWNRDNAIIKNTYCNKCRANKRKVETPIDGWSKKCPKCENKMKYSTKPHLMLSIKNNSLCKKCSINKKYQIENDYSRKCKKCNTVLKYSARRNLIRSMKIDGLCFDCNLKNNKFAVGVRNYKTKEKQRLARIKLIENKIGRGYGYNPIACNFIDKYGEEKGCNFQHALNGGEIVLCGYKVDGYDKNKNVIFEYDEPHHYNANGELIKKDKIRQNIIINEIKPKSFLRYDEKNDKLYDVVNNIYS